MSVIASTGETVWGIAFWVLLAIAVIAYRKRRTKGGERKVVVKTVKSQRAAERAIEYYLARGYELQGGDSRRMNYSVVSGLPATVMFGPLGLVGGLFTKRQKYTLTFVLKNEAQQPSAT